MPERGGAVGAAPDAELCPRPGVPAARPAPGMSTQLPTWRFHAVDPSLLVRVDQVDVEASVRPPKAKSTRPASSNAAGKAAATRKMDQLKEQIAVRRASHDLEQLKMQIAARQAAVAAPSAANVARVKKRSQQPAADGAEAGSSAAGAGSPAKRLRKAAAAKPAPAAAPAPAPPLGKVDNGRSLTTTAAASPVDDDDERPLTEGQLRRVLTALDAAGLLAAPGAEARAQAALRPLLAGPSAPAALLPLAAPALPPADGPAAAARRSPDKKGVVARVPAKRGSAAPGKEAGKPAAGSSAPAAATTATAAGAGAATVTTAGTAGAAASKSGGAPPAASVARASALLARHVARFTGATEPAPMSAALQQLLIDCRACLANPNPNPNLDPNPSPNPNPEPQH